MRIFVLAIALALAFIALAKWKRKPLNVAKTKSESVVTRKVVTNKGITQVNATAFNAFNIWNDGQGIEVLDYPLDYGVTSGNIPPDSVFYVDRESYWNDQERDELGLPINKFIGVPTQGAKVVNGVLEYPLKNGMQLKLKFTAPATNDMKLADAVQYCKKLGLRMPTVRELFDFCAAGVTEPKYGPNFDGLKYPRSARCAIGNTWSASVLSNNRRIGWPFSGQSGQVFNGLAGRENSLGVRCVGSAK